MLVVLVFPDLIDENIMWRGPEIGFLGGHTPLVCWTELASSCFFALGIKIRFARIYLFSQRNPKICLLIADMGGFLVLIRVTRGDNW